MRELRIREPCTGSPTLKELSGVLPVLLKPFRRTFILVDAIDEHLTNDNEGVPSHSFLNELLALQSSTSVPIFTLFMTSRENPLIEQSLRGCDRIDIRASDSDVESYVRSRIFDDKKFTYAKKMRDDSALASLVIKSLVEKAQGM